MHIWHYQNNVTSCFRFSLNVFCFLTQNGINKTIFLILRSSINYLNWTWKNGMNSQFHVAHPHTPSSHFICAWIWNIVNCYTQYGCISMFYCYLIHSTSHILQWAFLFFEFALNYDFIWISSVLSFRTAVATPTVMSFRNNIANIFLRLLTIFWILDIAGAADETGSIIYYDC